MALEGRERMIPCGIRREGEDDPVWHEKHKREGGQILVILEGSEGGRTNPFHSCNK